MTGEADESGAARNVVLYPWFRFFQSLVFWQAIWFLYFQNELSAAEAVMLYAIYDVGTTLLEVPSGYMSDRLGRRFTLISAAIAGTAGTALFAAGDSFAVFALAQILVGTAAAFASGTDSAMLYESLKAVGRDDEIERQELKAWRFSFTALAISAVTGGLMALHSYTLPFIAGTFSFVGVLVVTLAFREPPPVSDGSDAHTASAALKSLKVALTKPALVWLFALSVVMYVFSHVPFVFGQPYILEALKDTGIEAQAPSVSGVVTALMMLLSVTTSLFALKLRERMGLPAILLLAFGLQIGLSAVLALSSQAIVIAFLLVRMVPDSLSRPFILARIQPLLASNSRATYMSLQSLCGRVVFAGSLFWASRSASDSGAMEHNEIQSVLGWYVALGVIVWGALALAAIRTKIDHSP
ncbi:MFS transporter [Litoreibacter roseus]|uniref:MFS transporter n=1 Tax=Litoreibacter roseus TaxID=2601869 RepID=A0A6N6JDD3_9RHOB|nr:MFS transporter [Litoreibacter roseus]GFE64134.1 MFS transporter [Litoreibacter roseus]